MKKNLIPTVLLSLFLAGCVITVGGVQYPPANIEADPNFIELTTDTGEFTHIEINHVDTKAVVNVSESSNVEELKIRANILAEIPEPGETPEDTFDSFKKRTFDSREISDKSLKVTLGGYLFACGRRTIGASTTIKGVCIQNIEIVFGKNAKTRPSVMVNGISY